jgi:hypothetical protein
MAHESDERREDLFSDVVASLRAVSHTKQVDWDWTLRGHANVTYQLEHPEDRIDLPPLVGGEPLRGQGDLRRHTQLELVVRHLEEREKLACHDADITLVDERVGELEGASADRNVPVAQTVEDRVAVSLDGVGVHGHDLVERVERDVAEGARRLARTPHHGRWDMRYGARETRGMIP